MNFIVWPEGGAVATENTCFSQNAQAVAERDGKTFCFPSEPVCCGPVDKEGNSLCVCSHLEAEAT